MRARVAMWLLWSSGSLLCLTLLTPVTAKAVTYNVVIDNFNTVGSAAGGKTPEDTAKQDANAKKDATIYNESVTSFSLTLTDNKSVIFEFPDNFTTQSVPVVTTGTGCDTAPMICIKGTNWYSTSTDEYKKQNAVLGNQTIMGSFKLQVGAAFTMTTTYTDNVRKNASGATITFVTTGKVASITPTPIPSGWLLFLSPLLGYVTIVNLRSKVINPRPSRRNADRWSFSPRSTHSGSVWRT
jgi:hypothetical protein